MPSYHSHLLLNVIRGWPFWRLGMRRSILRRMGIRIADSAIVRSGSNFRHGPIEIGAGAFINEGCLLDPGGPDGDIRIGHNVHVGHRTMLLAISHDIGGSECRAGAGRRGPIQLEAGSWLGAGVILMPGVTIGQGAVIGAGAVVTRDCAADAVHVGVPARQQRSLPTSANPSASIGTA